MTTINNITWKNYFGVSSVNIFIAATQNVLSAWLMYYYTTYAGLSIMAVGTLFAISKLAGAFFSLFFGDFSDKFGQTRLGKKFGRRRFWLLMIIPVHTILFPLVWLPGMSVGYYYVIYILYNCVLRVPQIIIPTLTTEMTTDSTVRAKIEGMKQAVGAIATTAISALPGVMFLWFGKDMAAFTWTMIVCNVLACIALSLQYRWSFERPAEDLHFVPGVSAWQEMKMVFRDLGSTLRIKAFRQLLAMFIAQISERTISGYVNTYFIIFVMMMSPTVVAGANSVAYLLGLLFLSFFMWYTIKTDGAKSFRLGAYVTVIVFTAFACLALVRPPHAEIWLIALTIILNFGKTGIANASFYLMSFIPDVDEIVTRERREALFSGVFNFVDTVIQALIMFVLGAVLSLTGFQQGVDVQPEHTIDSIIVIYTCVPLCFGLWGIIVSWRFRLNRDNHLLILQEISRLKLGGDKEQVDPQTRAAVEELTGLSYKQCWQEKPEGEHNLQPIGKNV
ncbi:MFS transporter [Pectobacterium cacticida]|uniref:MFS transporter n=1 Tax=Pectobacterium cacticida TaxID=69221 RepID=UPI0039865ABA